MRQAVALAFVALVLGACAEPLEFADWTMLVPSGVPVHEHSVLPLGERDAPPVRLVEDLVLGAGPELTFYGAPAVAVAPDGRVFVLDAGNQRVVVFSAEGALQMILGREGQGPGEFSMRNNASIAVSADRLRVDDRRNRRLSIWDLGGNFLETRPTTSLLVSHFAGLPDGNRVAYVSERAAAGSVVDAVVILDDDGVELQRLAQLSQQHGLPSRRHDYELSVRAPGLSYEVAPDGRIYVTDGAEYQVYAWSPSGEMVWALRTDYAQSPYPEEYKERIVSVRRSNPRVADLRVSDFDWPESWPALLGVAVDGHGHVYVRPLTYPYAGVDTYPVDVFSADGDLLYSGSITGATRMWSAAHGDFVYVVGEQESGDRVVVRYRVEEPW